MSSAPESLPWPFDASWIIETSLSPLLLLLILLLILSRRSLGKLTTKHMQPMIGIQTISRLKKI